MTEPLLCDLGVHPRLQQGGRVTVTKIVQPDRLEAPGAKEPPEHLAKDLSANK